MSKVEFCYNKRPTIPYNETLILLSEWPMARFEPTAERSKSKGSFSFDLRSTFKNRFHVRNVNMNAVHVFN